MTTPLSLLHSCSLWQARPWLRHTNRFNSPAAYETSFSEGERATITTLFDCGSLENRELAREPSECAHAHEKYATPHISLAGGRRLLRSHNKTHNVRSYRSIHDLRELGCGLETHTALGCCMSLSTTPLVHV